jgi:hypothetical protein
MLACKLARNAGAWHESLEQQGAGSPARRPVRDTSHSMSVGFCVGLELELECFLWDDVARDSTLLAADPDSLLTGGGAAITFSSGCAVAFTMHGLRDSACASDTGTAGARDLRMVTICQQMNDHAIGHGLHPEKRVRVQPKDEQCSIWV